MMFTAIFISSTRNSSAESDEKSKSGKEAFIVAMRLMRSFRVDALDIGPSGDMTPSSCSAGMPFSSCV